MQTVHIKNNQNFVATAIPTSPDGQVGVLVPGSIPSWSSSDTTVATVTPAVDGMSAVVTAVGKIGTVQIDAGAPVIAFGPNFTSSFLVVIDPNPADHFEFTFSNPVNNQ